MAEQPQSLKVERISIQSPQPPLADIEAAAKGIPGIMADLSPGLDGTVSIKSKALSYRLRNAGHTRAAADWAIRDLIAAKHLIAQPDIHYRANVSSSFTLLHKTDWGSQSTPNQQFDWSDRDFPIDRITVLSTESLWAWWRDEKAKDSQSAFAEYVRFIVVAHQSLMDWTRRDDEAIKLLTDRCSATLKEQEHHFNKIFCDELGHLGNTPRIWTTRDKKWLDYCDKERPGWWQKRRTSYLIRYLERRFEELFQNALIEIRKDGLGAAIATDFSESRKAFEELNREAQQFTYGESNSKKVFNAGLKLSHLATKLQPWTSYPNPNPTVLVNGQRPDQTFQEDHPLSAVKLEIAELRGDWPTASERNLANPQSSIDYLWALLLRVPGIQAPECPTITSTSMLEAIYNGDSRDHRAKEQQSWREFTNALIRAEKAIQPKLSSLMVTDSPDTHAQDSNRRQRGRQKADYATEQKERQLYLDWRRARDQGILKDTFAADNGMTVKDFDRLLDRVSKRERRADKTRGK